MPIFKAKKGTTLYCPTGDIKFRREYYETEAPEELESLRNAGNEVIELSDKEAATIEKEKIIKKKISEKTAAKAEAENKKEEDTAKTEEKKEEDKIVDDNKLEDTKEEDVKEDEKVEDQAASQISQTADDPETAPKKKEKKN